MKQYHDLVKHVLENGTEKSDRTGTGTKSVFGYQMRFDLQEGFPLVTTKKLHLKSIIYELLWFLKGETNIGYLKDNGVKIWDAWADENGDLGPVYGHQLRNFNSQGIDQLEKLIWNLCSEPDSRRHVVSLWNPAEQDKMALPPCYLYFQFFVENDRLNMFVVQRSGDMYLGVPYDVALFTLVLNYVASKTGLIVGKLAINIIDAHVYTNQVEAANKYLDEKNMQCLHIDFVLKKERD